MLRLNEASNTSEFSEGEMEKKPVALPYWFQIKEITNLDFEQAFHLAKAHLKE